jgi:putative tryptophan/tyrosine transport system substrate-binding protein
MNTLGKALLVALGLVVSLTAVAWTQPVANVPRIGLLWSVGPNDASSPPYIAAFERALREAGFVEGRNVRVEHRYADGKLDRFPALAAELVHAKVDVIVAASPLSIRAARAATEKIPIVMINGDPAMFASLSRPGGNITGLTAFQAELAGKQVELLKEAVPKITKVALLRNLTQPVHALKLKEAEAVARALKLAVHVVDAQAPDDIEAAVVSAAKERAGGLVVFADGMYNAYRARIADIALRQGLPTVFGTPGAADSGGLINYLPSPEETYGRAATYVVRILKGAPAGDLPIQQPTRFELSINLKTARALSIALPQTLVVRADRIIE